MKGARFLLILMVLLASPLFSIQTPVLYTGSIIETKSLFFWEEVTVQNIRCSENSIIQISDIVGIKPEELTIGKVSRTYKNAVETSKRFVNSKKMIKTRGHPNLSYKNKIG